MNNCFYIFKASLAARIFFYIFAAFAFFIFFNGTIEASSFPERQCFPKIQNINFIDSGRIGKWFFSFSKQDCSDWLNDFVEFSPFVSSESKSVANKKANETCNQRYSWMVKGCLEQFPHEPLACALLSWIIYFLLGCLIGYVATKIYNKLFFP